MQSRADSRWMIVLAWGGLLAACSAHSSPSEVDGASMGSSVGGSSGGPLNVGVAGQGVAGLSADSACAAVEATAELTPVNLVMMYDRSGSMGDTSNGFDPRLRWDPVNAGMEAFFTDPGSHGLAASLQFFPVDGDLATACVGPYDTPEVPLTSLADSSALQGALSNTKPHGGTPTLPALEGAIQYATRVQKDQPHSRTVVVLVTDGEPGFLTNGQLGPGCASNDVSHVVAVAQAAHAQTPPLETYVIGVGPSLEALNAIALAGGTGKAMLVAAGDPMQTKIDVQQALGSIRSLQLSCDMPLPKPPDASELDTSAVNVRLTTAAEGAQIIGYDENCSVGNGWMFDNRAAPTKIELCSSSCAKGQVDPTARLSVLFGCKTITVLR